MAGTARFMTNLWAFNAITRSIESLLNKRHRRRRSGRQHADSRAEFRTTQTNDACPPFPRSGMEKSEEETKHEKTELGNHEWKLGLTGGQCARSNVSQCNNARINRFIRTKWTCVWVQMCVLIVGQTGGKRDRNDAPTRLYLPSRF